MKTVHTRIGKDSDVYIYTEGDSGYYAMLGAKFKSAFINDASASALRSFLLQYRGKKIVNVPTDFMDKIVVEARKEHMVRQPEWMM